MKKITISFILLYMFIFISCSRSLNDRLSSAVRKGDSNLSLRLIEDGADVNAIFSDDGKTLLMLESKYGRDLNGVKILVENGADINAIDSNGNTAPFYAAYMGRLDVIKYFNEVGFNYKNTNYIKPILEISALTDRLDILKYLIEDLQINISPYNDDIIEKIVSYDAYYTFDIINYLVDKNAKVNEDSLYLTITSFIDESNRDIDMLLDENTLIFNYLFDNYKKTHKVLNKDFINLLLIEASTRKKLGIINKLLNEGADVNFVSDDLFDTALLATCRSMFLKSKTLNVAKTLIVHKADVNSVDKFGYSPLNYAAEGKGLLDKDLELVKLLVENGADISHTNNEGKTSLELARDGKIKDYFLSLENK